MKFPYFQFLLSIALTPYDVSAAEGSNETEIHDGIVHVFRPPSVQNIYQTVGTRLDHVITAFKEINITPLKALDTGDASISLFCTLPDQFIKFVHSKQEVPPSKRVNLMYASGKEPQYNCDFWYDLSYGEKAGFRDAVISLGHGSFSVPDLSIRLWGYKDLTTNQILATHNTVIFNLHIYRGLEGLTRGLKDVVSKKLLEGFYVIIPKETQQIDWQTNPEVVEKFRENQKEYLYQWEQKL